MWTKTEQKLVDFLNDLNINHVSIKFESIYSKEHIVFRLDIMQRQE